MPTIIYVDNDDEITSAAARIRTTDAGPVALVIPSGSRLSTSRINFRLLAREAQTRGRRLAIVAGEGSTRALAASAGLPVFGSVGEFEASVSDESTPPVVVAASTPPVAAQNVRPAAAGRARQRTLAAPPPPPPSPPPGSAPTVAEPAPAAPTSAAPRDAGSIAMVLPALLPRRVALGRPAAAVVAALVVLALLVLGVGAYLLLPSATITVTPHQLPVGPLALSIRADPAVPSSDPVAGVVPAQRLSFDLAASDTFAVKGRRIQETRATGRVTFRSKDPTRENRIASGSVVSTSAGVRFRTTSSVSIPRATFVGLTVIPGQASVGVEAVQPGLGGIVDANAITVVPANEDPILTDVRNRNPTSGGTHQEFPRVDQADLDAAVNQLSKQLEQDFDAVLAEPGRVPAVLTAFAETRSMNSVASIEPATLLGQEVATFDLQLTGTGSIVAVDESLVKALAVDRTRAAAAGGNALVEGSVQADLGQPTVNGESIVFPVTARATQVRVVDRPGLVRMIKGTSVPQARAALEAFGDVQLTVWPDWVSSIPTIDSRIDLRVAQPTGAP